MPDLIVKSFSKTLLFPSPAFNKQPQGIFKSVQMYLIYQTLEINCTLGDLLLGIGSHLVNTSYNWFIMTGLKTSHHTVLDTTARSGFAVTAIIGIRDTSRERSSSRIAAVASKPVHFRHLYIHENEHVIFIFQFIQSIRSVGRDVSFKTKLFSCFAMRRRSVSSSSTTRTVLSLSFSMLFPESWSGTINQNTEPSSCLLSAISVPDIILTNRLEY